MKPEDAEAELSRLLEECDELEHTKGVDSPEYQAAWEKLQRLQAEAGLENDPGIDPDD
jgi:hypothetical protein